MLQMTRLRTSSLALIVALTTTACTDPYFSQDLENIGVSKDLSGISSTDLCDAASYFTYDDVPAERQKAQRLLAEVHNRGDISRKDYNSALTGDAELGMTDMAVVCAWGLPYSEEEYYLADGRKYTRWVYQYDDYGNDRSIIEFVGDRVVSLDTDG